MDPYFVIAVIIAMTTVHIVRPDLSRSIIDFTAPRIARFVPNITFTLSIITNSIAAANQVRQGLLGIIMRGIHSLQDLPWEEYYTWTADTFHLGTRYLAELDALFRRAGVSWIGWGGCLALCIMAAFSVLALIRAIRSLLRILYAVAAWSLRIVRNVSTWMLSFFRFIYRLVFRPPGMSNPVTVHQGAVPLHANRVPVTSNPVVVHQGASSSSTRQQGSR